jgi:lipopolysaccharide/colanic/teichoic acid biosynthesis glycosyltransferase
MPLVSAHPSPLETRRILDVAISLPALVVLAPLLALIAALIWLEDGTPVLFRQDRVGRFGRCFRILKFRTMAHQASGKMITVAGDSRITRTGAVLRRLKLDELLQLLNVLKGEMSLCGPRPEVPCYVNPEDPLWQTVLQERPGITDPASLLYGQEEQLLAKAPDPEKTYRQYVLPQKLRISANYLARRSCWTDLKLVLLTARYSFLPGLPAPHFIQQVLFGDRS